ncbi:MAG: hypothetical protein KYX68_14070 [Flavobacterium sp.]|nr:hypothetical protein [Flavobacterium sp.]
MKSIENWEYTQFLEYLEKKNTPKAKKLLEKLKTFEEQEQYAEWKFFALFDALLSVS